MQQFVLIRRDPGDLRLRARMQKRGARRTIESIRIGVARRVRTACHGGLARAACPPYVIPTREESRFLRGWPPPDAEMPRSCADRGIEIVVDCGSVEEAVATYGFIYGRTAIDYLIAHHKSAIRWKPRLYYRQV
jgi:hypothetical protein